MLFKKSSLFHNRNFLLLWGSQILSQFSINIMNFLVLVHVYETTGSSIASSFVWIAYGLPVVMVGPFLAAVVELNDKRKMMLYANVAQAAVIGLYAVYYQQYFYLSYAVVSLYSLLDQIYVPAETASIPIFINKKNLARANGLFFLTAQAAAVIGFGMAGLIMEFLGFPKTMILGTIMLLLAAVMAFAMPKISPKRENNQQSLELKIREYMLTMIDGFKYIYNDKKILLPISLLVLLQVYLVMFVVNLPAIGEQIIMTSNSYVGILTVLPIGLGAVTGSFIIPRLLENKIRKYKIIINALLTASVVMITMPLLSAVLPFWSARILIILGFAVVGFSFVSTVIPAITYLQTHTQDDYMARVFGNFWFTAYLFTLLPTIFSASITEVLGARTMLVIMGLAMFGVYIYARTRAEKIIDSL